MHLCTNFDVVMSFPKFLVFIYFAAISSLLFFSCANQVSPGGGPQDEDPPVVLKSVPPNFSIGFNKKTIQLTFNEFVKLKQANQQILISPPTKTAPNYKLKGKSVIIELQDELLPNTTYSIFFGNAIVDITEENPLTDFLYVFSTGNYIDSLSLAGEIMNAFTLKPEGEVFVMLYSLQNDTIPIDSLPMLVRPLYVAKTDKNGLFRLQYLRNEPMKLFALRDMNSNYLFDIPDEEIAFIDSLVIPEIPLTIEPDTSSVAKSDSLIYRDLYQNYYPLRLFQHVDSTQRLINQEGFYPPKFRLVFKQPTDSLSIELLNSKPESDWKIEEFSARKDSLLVWITNPALDSLDLKILIGDTIFDTIQIVIPEKKVPKSSQRRRDDEETIKPERLIISNNIKARTIEMYDSFFLTFDNPLVSFDFSNVLLIAGLDTITGAPFSPTDSIRRRFKFERILKEETFYDLTFPDSSFYDIYGLTNDSLRFTFTTRKVSEYGNIFIDLKLQDETYPHIIQLLDIKDKVIRELYIEQSGELRFELLNPAVYRLKAIRDKWLNRVWDTGKYNDHRQPEDVFFFPLELQVRPNWDVQESWVID